MTGLDIARVRPVIESEIERLIGILDLLEPDPDFEDGADAEADMADDEPWLGAFECSQFNGRGTNWGINSQGNDDREDDGDDREEVSEDEGAQCDDEYEFGWTEREAAADSSRYPYGDSEPNLGSINTINQVHWAAGQLDDAEEEFDGREECCEDEGADHDNEEDNRRLPAYLTGPWSPVLAVPS